jgi:hypothetical protein
VILNARRQNPPLARKSFAYRLALAILEPLNHHE